MEIDECSVNGDSGAEDDEDEELSQGGGGSGTESSSNDNNSSSSNTTTDSGEESADEQPSESSSSESNSSVEEDDEDNCNPNDLHLEERTETVVAGGTKVKLPQDLCEQPSIFKEMLDYPRFWDEGLSESQKESLYSFLPNFPKDCNIEAELDKTLDMLFQREITRFGVNPLDDFHKHLSAGHYRPDIKKMRSSVKKAQKRKYIFEERKRAYELTGKLLKSRENLLSSAYKQGFSQPSHRTTSKSSSWKKPKPDLLEERTSLRYTEELNAINVELGSNSQLGGSDSDSEDDYDDDDGISAACLLTPSQASTGGKLQQQLQLLQQQQRKKKRAALVVQQQQQQQQQLLTTKAMHFSLGDEDLRPVYSTLQRIGTECGSVGVGTGLASITIRPELSEESYRTMLVAHKKRRARRDAHPELNTHGIALSDLMQRTQLGQKHKLSFVSSSSSTNRTPSSSKKRIKVEQPPHQYVLNNVKVSATPVKMETEEHHVVTAPATNLIEQPDQKPPERLLAEELVKDEPIELAEQKYEIEPPTAQPPPTIMDEEPEPVHDEIASTMDMMEIKEEVQDIEYMEAKAKVIDATNSILVNDNDINAISVSIPMATMEDEEMDDKKDLDLDSIDMMQLPIQLDDGIDILADVKCEDGNIISLPDKDMANSIVEDIVMNGDELMQETHACFFSLIRDAFTSKGEFRMDRDEMKDAVMLWQDNPISPLNDWYSLVPSWPALVPLALGFLAGELVYPQDPLLDGDQELVPYLENKGRGVYAWIGAGRDSDSHLAMLCNKFLLYKDSLIPPKPPPTTTVVKQTQHVQIQQQQPQPQQQQQQQPQQLSQEVILGTELLNSTDASSTVTLDSSAPEWEPPKALCPTDWKVRPSTPEEREEFHRQERLRYAAPHKAFTYRMHGYSSVVGPVKGIYQHNASTAMAKARGHSLLVPDRPNFVTILALVRDATARLPNGEGTRADICTLLKDSQYIQEHMFSHDKEANLNSVVSGALDRLHYEHDPCVRYYPKRKEWLYLHRARSESEFELFHQQLQGIPKNKKTSSSSARGKNNSSKSSGAKDANATTLVKEPTPKKDKKSQSGSSAARKDQKKVEEKLLQTKQQIETPPSAQPQQPQTVKIQPPQVQQQKVLQAPKLTQGTSIPITITMNNSSNPVSSTAMLSIVTTAAPTTTNAAVLPSIASIPEDAPKFNITSAPAVAPVVKKANVNIKSVAVVKPASAGQSLLQSNQQHFPHQQIQVSTSAGLQTIRLSGHSVLQASSPSTGAPKVVQSQQQTGGKSLLQTSNLKPQPQAQAQQQQQQVIPGKTLLAGGIKLVSTGHIKSLLTSHGLQGQTIFIKQPATAAQVPAQGQPQRVVQAANMPQQRVIQGQQQQQQQGMQRIIAQIGGKPVQVQIQQSPQQQQPQQNQQKVLAKVLSSASGQQLISVESLLAQKGLKLATTTGHPGQQIVHTRQGNKVIQTQYQVVTQSQSLSGQPKIIVSSPQLQQSQGTPQQQQQQASTNQQTVRMLTAQLAGKPIILSSSPTGKTNVVLQGKQINPGCGQQQQQPIILPNQLLNIKTLQGLKVISTPGGLKTTGGPVFVRVPAQTASGAQGSQQNATVVTVQQPQQQQNPRNSPFTGGTGAQ